MVRTAGTAGTAGTADWLSRRRKKKVTIVTRIHLNIFGSPLKLRFIFSHDFHLNKNFFYILYLVISHLKK